jgi:ABC-type nitrate/sulfonate/bicarbonate transport system substrate-binding protein
LDGVADGFWGNALRAEYAARKNIVTVLADIRHGDGPRHCWSFTFPALLSTERFVNGNREAAGAVVRAIVNTQRALRSDAALAARAAKQLFPLEEAAMISDLIKRDSKFYDAKVSRRAFESAVQFAREVGLITRAISYEEMVVEALQHFGSAKPVGGNSVRQPEQRKRETD